MPFFEDRKMFFSEIIPVLFCRDSVQIFLADFYIWPDFFGSFFCGFKDKFCYPYKTYFL